MNIKFTARNAKLTGALKGYAEKQLETIEKISGDIINAEIIASGRKLDFKVELTMKTKHHSYHLETKDPILKQALRSILNTLKAQAKKNKEKLKEETKRKRKTGIFKKFAASAEKIGTREKRAADRVPQVTVLDNFSRKPISVEEAIFFLKQSGENAYMFVNAETDRITVVFYNKGKNISLIDAAM